MTPYSGRPVRVVIDSSVVLPILLRTYPNSSLLAQLWQAGRLSPLVNSETIQELSRKLLERSPFPKIVQARLFVDRAFRQYQPWCEEVGLKPATGAPECRDPTDQMFIDLAISGDAEVLVSNDQDLLSMAGQTPFRILTEGAFLKEMCDGWAESGNPAGRGT